MTDQSNDKSNQGLKAIGSKTPKSRPSMGTKEQHTPTTPDGFVNRDGTPIDVSTETGADKLIELLSEPTAEEIVFFEDRDRRGLGVGTDATGKIVTAATDEGARDRLKESRRWLLKELETRTEMLDAQEVAELLRVREAKIADMEIQKRFFGYATKKGWRYPGFQFDHHGDRSYPILKRILTEADDMLPVHLMRFLLCDNWSLTSKYGDFIPGNRMIGWPAYWLAFDEPRVYDLFIEELRRETRG